MSAEPRICRRWRGKLKSADEAAYREYFRETGARDYGGTPGCLGFQLHYRPLGNGETEVVTLSWWRSIRDIQAFSGSDITRARYYPDDTRFLTEMPPEVEHFTVEHDEVIAGPV